MTKEIILGYDPNQTYRWLRLYFFLDSKLLCSDASNVNVKISADDSKPIGLGNYNLSSLVDISQIQKSVVQLDISNIVFRKISVKFENLTQPQFEAINAGIV